jgi:hypothetical protein
MKELISLLCLMPARKSKQFRKTIFREKKAMALKFG